MRDDGLRLPTLRLWAALLFGLALAVGLALGGNPAAHAQDGAMAVDCEGNTRAMETDCQFGEGQEFQIAVQITDPPGGGYFGFQSRLSWDGGILEYRATENASQEAVWPDCGIAARQGTQAAGPILYGCVPFPALDAGSTLTGPVILFTFACSGEGPTEVELVAGGALDSQFLVSNVGDMESASVSGATVTCSGLERDRPEPEFEAGVESALGNGDTERTPVPDATPGGPTPEGGEPTAAAIQTPTSQTTPEGTLVGLGTGAIEDEDDGGFPVWGWVLIGLAVVAGAGGLGFVAWRRARAGGEGEGEPGGAEGDAGEGETESDGDA